MTELTDSNIGENHADWLYVEKIESVAKSGSKVLDWCVKSDKNLILILILSLIELKT